MGLSALLELDLPPKIKAKIEAAMTQKNAKELYCQRLSEEKNNAIRKGFSMQAVIYGKQVITHLLNSHQEKLQEIYLSKEIDKKLFFALKKACPNIIKVDNKKAQSLAKGGNHQGVLAKVELPLAASLKELKKLKNFWCFVALRMWGILGVFLGARIA